MNEDDSRRSKIPTERGGLLEKIVFWTSLRFEWNRLLCPVDLNLRRCPAHLPTMSV